MLIQGMDTWMKLLNLNSQHILIYFCVLLHLFLSVLWGNLEGVSSFLIGIPLNTDYVPDPLLNALPIESPFLFTTTQFD